MKIFITGGTGFIGRALIGRMKAEGHELFALSRRHESDTWFDAQGVKPIHGSLEAVDEFATSLSGMDVVIHAAAPVSFWGERSWFHQQVVEASEALAKAAIDAGVQRFIYLSSEATLQNKKPLVDIDEHESYPPQNNSIYGESKRLAEQRLLRLRHEIDMLILRPSFVWGDQSENLNKIIEKARRGEFVWLGDAQHAFEAVHISNLVEAVCCSLSAGKSGEIYFITDHTAYTVHGFFEAIFKSHHVTRKIRSMPVWLGKLAAATVEAAWTLFRLKTNPPLLKFEVAFLAQPRRYRIDKAIKELGYHPQTHLLDSYLSMNGSVSH